MGIPDHLTCLLRNLYTGTEATVRTKHETTDWFKIQKGVCQGWILLPCLFISYPEYITGNAGLDQSDAGIKIAGRNSNNLRYADNTTLMVKNKDPASGPINSWQIDGETTGTVTEFILGLQNHCGW